MQNVSELGRGFETNAILMEPHWQVTFQAPEEDIDRIFDHITEFAPLEQGKTDKNAYRSANGFEYYRPREGTPTGPEEEVRKRPGVAEVSFFIPRDKKQLDLVIEAIYAVHSYYEPVITVNSQAGPELAAAWVRYTNQGPGPPVRYWEFGDEAWGPWAPGHTDPATYVTRFRAAQAAMEGVDPAIRLAAHVSLDPARAQAWNRPVLAGLADILEAVSFTFFPQDPGEEDHRTLQESTERFREQLAGLRAQVRELLGSRAQEVLFLLAGYNSVSWDPGPQTLGEGQLLWLAEMVGALIEAGVDLATYWTLLSEPSPRGGDYGLLQGPPAFRARPAYQVFAALRELPGGRWWRLPTGLPDVGLQVLESAAGQVSVLLTNWSAAMRLVDLRLRYQGRVLHVGEAWQVTAGGTEELVLQGLGGPIRVPGRSVIFAHLVPDSEAVTDYN
ncbi:MAG: hypothetical protein ACE5IM_12650, partial [Nitrospinota bacterium]